MTEIGMPAPPHQKARDMLYRCLADFGLILIEDEIREIIALALRAADDDELQRAGLKKIADGR